MEITQTIQSILAPAIMISSCGLLLLGLNNRYSSVINRIRLLNNERRKYVEIFLSDEQMSFHENARLQSLLKQIDHLMTRCKYVRNAIVLIISAIGLFVVTSLLISINFIADLHYFQNIALYVFILGMLSVCTGMCFAGIEVILAYKIAIIEVKAEE
jgi:hypothetical protein